MALRFIFFSSFLSRNCACTPLINIAILRENNIKNRRRRRRQNPVVNYTAVHLSRVYNISFKVVGRPNVDILALFKLIYTNFGLNYFKSDSSWCTATIKIFNRPLGTRFSSMNNRPKNDRQRARLRFR